MTEHIYKVLIIDDSASDRKIYRRFIAGQELYRFEIHEAATASAGMHCCRSMDPDCIILDYQLPDRDGLEVLADIQAVSHAPVIFITGKPEALVVTEAYNRGAASYISKDTVTSKSMQEALFDALELHYKHD